MSEPIPTDPEAPDEEPIPVDPDFPPEDPVPPEPEPVEPGPEMPGVGGWLDAAAQAEADAKQYTDEQVPLIAGRMVPRNMDRAPTAEDGTDLIAGTGWNQYDPTTNDLVQMWRWDGAAWQALDMSAEMIPVLDIGSATVGDLTGGRINVQDGPIVAGDPAGARVEITGDGLHAYDATGTETARIQGDEGVFVGGEFRTSDTLPGQVTLSDTANQGTPGLSVEPEDSTGYDALPSIGPGPDDMHISGGVSTDGTMSGAQFGATGTSIYHNGPGANGTGSWALVNGNEARLAYREDRTNVSRESGVWVRPSGATLFTEGDDGYGNISASSTAASLVVYSIAGDGSSDTATVRANLEDAMLSMRKQGGRTRRLRVDEGGVWAEIETGPNSWQYDSYNLLETAQDSGWAMATVASGYTAQPGYPPKARKVGNLVYLSGGVSGAGIGANTSQYVLTLPPGYRPVGNSIYVVGGSSTGAACPLFVILPDGRVSLRTTGTTGNYYLMDGLSFIPE